jgi:hypothetical protein|tara:strand:+ start:735 stop:881 length:147 start_codon:yes stop_codon:yes gene_type:complete
MVQHHRWSLTEIENMLPWEREIYVEKLIQHIKDENEKHKEQQRKQQYG